MAALVIPERALRVRFLLGTGPDGMGPFEERVVENLRMFATISNAGDFNMGTLDLRIWGMRLEDMNRINTRGRSIQLVRRNFVRVMAGDTDNPSGFSQVYEGTIYTAWVDFQGMPEVSLGVIGHAGAWEAVKPTTPTSYPNPVDVAQVMRDLATKMDLGFENGGVQGNILSSPSFDGTGYIQMQKAARAAGINATVDNGVLIIWPSGGKRPGPTPLINANVMYGAPTYTPTAVLVTTLFNKAYRYGASAQLSSEVVPQQVNGEYRISSMRHRLSSKLPGGPWFSDLQISPPGSFSTPAFRG